MLSKIAYALWPRPESENLLNPPAVFVQYYEGLTKLTETINSDVRSKLEEFTKTIFEDEEKRRESIEGKATKCLSSTGILATLTVGFSTVVVQGKLTNLDMFIGFAVVCFFVALVYLLRAALEALRVFGYIPRFCLGPDDIIPSETDTETGYSLSITKKLLRYTIENYKINNRQLEVAPAVWTECSIP